MSDNSFGLKLGIEGEKQFKAALKDINSTFKVLGSELTLVSSQFDKQDRSVEAVSARSRVLNKEIEEQKKKIALLTSALENATQSFGESDKRTQAWQVQLNNAKAELNKFDKELAENEKALDDTADGFDDAEKEADQFGDEVKKAGDDAKESGGKLETLGSIAKGVGVVLTAAVAAIGAAVKKTVGLINDCVDVYADFDDSMRQVAATMGMSGEDIISFPIGTRSFRPCRNTTTSSPARPSRRKPIPPAGRTPSNTATRCGRSPSSISAKAAATRRS